MRQRVLTLRELRPPRVWNWGRHNRESRPQPSHEVLELHAFEPIPERFVECLLPGNVEVRIGFAPFGMMLDRNASGPSEEICRIEHRLTKPGALHEDEHVPVKRVDVVEVPVVQTSEPTRQIPHRR